MCCLISEGGAVSKDNIKICSVQTMEYIGFCLYEGSQLLLRGTIVNRTYGIRDIYQVPGSFFCLYEGS